jgi:uncharacterized protein
MLPETVVISIVLSFATAIQSVVGFGIALFAVPLLLLFGIDLIPAIFMVLTVSFFSGALGVRRLRTNLNFRAAAGASLLRAVGVVPGYWAALATSKSSPANMKLAIGFSIGLGVLAQSRKLLVRHRQKAAAKPREEDLDEGQASSDNYEPSRKAAPWAFLSSGFLMGWLGMGGPPLIFWLLSGRQNPKKSRSFLYSVYVLTIPFQLLLMTIHNPETFLSTAPVLLVAIPICLLVTTAALKVGDKLDVDRLQWLSLALLTLLTLKAFFDWYREAGLF